MGIFSNDHSACGVGAIVNMGTKPEPSQKLVEDSVSKIACLEYRSGTNPSTKESDGAGLQFIGLPTVFFQECVTSGKFGENKGLKLEDGKYGIGQYFIPKTQEEKAKLLIKEKSEKLGLKIEGWRDLENDGGLNIGALSEIARAKNPAFLQAIIKGAKGESGEELEIKLRQLSQAIINACQEEDKKGLVAISSQSSKMIIYKSTVFASKLGEYFRDLNSPLFTARDVIMHTRFSTNTTSRPDNAQPTPYGGHNGELNSSASNCNESKQRKKAGDAITNPADSDSLNFSIDILNHLSNGFSLPEAITMLMQPLPSKRYSNEINNMLEYMALNRTPYNGPAFMVMSDGETFIAKVDSSGLRPARYAVIENKSTMEKRLYAASDQDVDLESGWEMIKDGTINPGEMIIMTGGKLITGNDALKHVHDSYLSRLQGSDKSFSFKSAKEKQVLKLDDYTSVEEDKRIDENLFEKLGASFWDKEMEDALKYFINNGKEQTGAMGGDITPFDRGHISQYFRQLFAQVSSPPIDSIKERDSFTLRTWLGANLSSTLNNKKQLEIKSPILAKDELANIIAAKAIPTLELSVCYKKNSVNTFEQRLKDICESAEKFAREKGGAIILSDKDVSKENIAIQDVIAVRAVKKHLEEKGLANNASIVVDSMQVKDSHTGSLLLGMGASAVYARGAYQMISSFHDRQPEFTTKDIRTSFSNFKKAMEFGLLKNMGKVGVTDVNNYINGKMFSALGLDLENSDDLQQPYSLASIFKGVANRLKGHNIHHFTAMSEDRAEKATKNPVLPIAGHFRPESGGIEHGFSNGVVAAFRHWMDSEHDKDTFYKLMKDDPKFAEKIENLGLSQTQGYIGDADIFNEDGSIKPYNADKFKYFQTSDSFKEFVQYVEKYREETPTTIYDYWSLKINTGEKLKEREDVQTQSEIRTTLFSGSISQGAITTEGLRELGNPKAHAAILRGTNAVGAMSSAGEGGENIIDINDPRKSAASKQIASGRFGVNANMIMQAKEIEIKVAQGAKPGEGGQLPGKKLTVRLATQRGAIPGVELISPPPHHDIYSIEDLEELIHDIKGVNPNVKVAVKLVASPGIGTIATGVAKAGADTINVASSSGGTGAAMQTSINNAGLPGEIGLREVDTALRSSGLRGLVKLKTSGGFKTPQDVIKAAIFGADLFEFGTVGMMTVGCVMQRTCYTSCEPGVAMNGEKFKGQPIDTARYFMNIASGVQDLLMELGVANLKELQGRFDLIKGLNNEAIKKFGLDELIQNAEKEIATPKEALEAKTTKVKRPIEDNFLEQFAKNNAVSIGTKTSPQKIASHDRTFGSRIAGKMDASRYKNDNNSPFNIFTDKNPLNVFTTGKAGQSYGFANAKAMHMHHTGFVQDGLGKSMSGGLIAVQLPEDKEYNAIRSNPTIAGNAAFYGASGGEGFVAGKAGNRFGILVKGATIVCEGAGEYVCEYMTSGTAMILGKTSKGLGNGAAGGVIFTYDEGNRDVSNDLEQIQASNKYLNNVKYLLEKHKSETGSEKAANILRNWDKEKSKFSVYIPTKLRQIDNLGKLIDVLETYHFRAAPISVGMQTWLNDRILDISKKILADADKLKIDLDKSISKGAGDVQAIHANITRLKESISDFAHKLKSNDYKSFIDDETKISVDTTVSKIFAIKLPEIKRAVEVQEHKSSVADVISAIKSKSWALKSTPKNHTISTATHVKDRILGANNPLSKRVGGHADYNFKDVIGHITEYAKSIENDASNCSGCKAQSCSGVGAGSGCPIEKPINAINGKMKELASSIKDGQQGLTVAQLNILREAFELQSKTTPFFAFTGAACPAPCQSACTEVLGGNDPVPIRNIEWNLYMFGRAMGWFEEENKKFTEDEKKKIFGSNNGAVNQIAEAKYKKEMNKFTAAFSRDSMKFSDETIVIVGSGPAAMQIAWAALRDGKKVEIYEKSDKPGGLLMDGIPHHKYGKPHVEYAFEQLMKMGGNKLKLYLNSNVEIYDKNQSFFINSGNKATVSSEGNHIISGQKIYKKTIFSSQIEDSSKKIVLCTGAGKARELEIDGAESGSKGIVQALPFLKAANDVAYQIQLMREAGVSEKNIENALPILVNDTFGDMNPTDKKILAVGGGDTAQDALRWSMRYLGASNVNPDSEIGIRNLEPSEKKGGSKNLIHLVRGPEANDSHENHPKMATAKTPENMKLEEEMQYAGFGTDYLAKVHSITRKSNGKMDIKVQHSKYELPEKIYSSPEKMKLFFSLSREARKQIAKIVPDESKGENGISNHNDVDMIVTALGTLGIEQDAFISKVKKWAGVFVAGDAHHDKPEIIVGAQASAMNTLAAMSGKELPYINSLSPSCATGCGTCVASGSCKDEKTVSQLTKEGGNCREDAKTNARHNEEQAISL